MDLIIVEKLQSEKDRRYRNLSPVCTDIPSNVVLQPFQTSYHPLPRLSEQSRIVMTREVDKYCALPSLKCRIRQGVRVMHEIATIPGLRAIYSLTAPLKLKSPKSIRFASKAW